MKSFAIALLLVTLAVADIDFPEDVGNFNIGRGIADITSTVAEVGFMGYAMLQQKGAGLHFRQRARAFVFVDPTNPDPTSNRVAYVNLDACMSFQSVKQDVVMGLQAKFGPTMYTYENVMLSSTHTHSGSAGYSRRMLYEVASLGFYKDNFDVVVNGIINAIVDAHNNVQPASMYLAAGELDKSNINRSPASYLLNPLAEREKYQYNTDHTMTLIRMEDYQSNPFALLNWFAVHGTSMNNTNLLVSGDNKGYAEYLYEKWMNGNSSLPGTGPFMAVFSQSNEGDVSPNTRGPSCPDGSPCDFVTSTCGPNNSTVGCIASGPGSTDFESCQIIGTQQAEFAQSLFNQAASHSNPVRGGLAYRHMWVDMSNLTVDAQWTNSGRVEQTCLPALGYGFAGGTTDGPGDFPFAQGTTNNTANPFWAWITSFLGKPSAQQIACQDPKPILLDVSIYQPLPWVETIVPLQIFRLGQLYIIGVPGEFTTMSGRRLRDTVKSTLIQNGAPQDITVVIAGLSNSYTHYIATYEEYQLQRYEGASTLYGPNTLAGYQQEYAFLAQALQTGQPVPSGVPPIDLTNKTFSLIPPVIVDGVPAGYTFGSVQSDVSPSYKRGDIVSVTFYGGNPRNNLMTDATFLTVEYKDPISGQWRVIANDGDWSTKFYWSRRGTVDYSYNTVTWQVDADPSVAPAGTYRIGHFGYYKEVVVVLPYSGYSSEFQVTA